MGVRALDLDHWFVFDERSPTELALKAQLRRERRADVVASTAEATAAEEEAAAMVAAWLDRHRPLSPAPVPPRPHAGAAPAGPLEEVALRVPEDLCLMLERDGRYVLGAGSVSFPSHWRLQEKMGRSLAEIHAPVHHYAADLSSKVDTFFARLTPERPVLRRNVSVHDHEELHRPEPPEDYDRLDPTLEQLWLRSERQTLVRLPRARAVLFTIKTQQCPVTDLAHAPAVARGLAAKYRALLPELDRTGDPAPVPRWLPDALERLAGPS